MAMRTLIHKPNILYLVYVRLPKIAFLITCPKLLRNVYKNKLLNARTTIRTMEKDGAFYIDPYTIIKYNFYNGKRTILHRENRPAYIKKSDKIIIKEKWYFNGKLHRDHGPALVRHNRKWNEWWQHGILHRDNGPAVECFDLTHYEWWNNGLLHRDNDPAIVKIGFKAWYKYGKVHRIGEPAVIHDNMHEWYVDGKLHRIDGPAIHYISMPSKNEYWLNGEKLEIQGKKKKYVTWFDNNIQFKFIIPKQFL